MTSRYLVAPALAFALCAQPAGAEERISPDVRSFEVTNVTATPAGDVVTHELLSIVNTPTVSRIAVASTDGTVVSLPVTYTPEGQIDTQAQDAGVTCFNMAMNALAHEGTPNSPASVFVSFGNSVVTIPLTVLAVKTAGNDRTTALHGASAGTFTDGSSSAAAGIRIAATVERVGTDLRSATFDEIHYVGSADNVVARSTCQLHSAAERATARV